VTDIVHRHVGPMMAEIAEWCGRTGKEVLAADDPGAMVYGYVTGIDEDPRYWKISLSDVKTCDFLKEEHRSSRKAVLRLFHTADGRKELMEHIDTCETCLPACVQES
jgi:hypothetical protein